MDALKNSPDPSSRSLLLPRSQPRAERAKTNVTGSKISRLRKSGNHLVAFEHFADLPTRQNVGDAAVLLDAGGFDFSDQLAVAVHEQFAILLDALVFTELKTRRASEDR